MERFSTMGFNVERAKEFKGYLKRAEDERLECFVYDGHEFLVSYAKYLVEHLTNIGLIPKGGDGDE